MTKPKPKREYYVVINGTGRSAAFSETVALDVARKTKNARPEDKVEVCDDEGNCEEIT